MKKLPIVFSFNRDAFLAYLKKEFRCFAGTCGCLPLEMVNNLISHILRETDVEDCIDVIPTFLNEIIPDVTFGEVAMFVDDECLSEKGKALKREAITQADLKARAREKK